MRFHCGEYTVIFFNANEIPTTRSKLNSREDMDRASSLQSGYLGDPLS